MVISDPERDAAHRRYFSDDHFFSADHQFLGRHIALYHPAQG
jgi:hypothetical protein